MVKCIKFLIGVGLLPLLVSSVRLFVGVVGESYTAVPWLDAGCFLLGFSFFVIYYAVFPSPVWLYVLGHECTHAVAVLFSGGKISGMRVSSEGGYVVSNKMNFWIALSPYIVPFWPLVVGGIWVGLVQWIPEVRMYDWLFLFLWGLSWGFHVVFTLVVLRREQPDFTSQGYVFSSVVVILCNVWLVTGMVWGWLEPFSWGEGWGQFRNNVMEDYGKVWSGVLWVVEQVIVFSKSNSVGMGWGIW